ncbi:MAG: TraB/GumN family protein [Muribaculaceae bacterium]|nr:TraB/GumN family protein [Muribaculaceae bacterium]
MNKNFFKVMLALTVIVSAGSASGQVLYKIEGNGLKSPSYVFGTHHVAPLSVAEQFGAIEPFNAATQIVGEIDMTQDQMALAITLQPHMMAPADSTLSKVISPQDMEVISVEFKKWAPMPGMELSMLEGMKPMVVSSMAVVGMCAESMPGFDPQAQLDSWFQSKGKAAGKTIIPLETAEQQAALLYDITPISVQAEELVDLLKEPKNAIEQTKTLSDAYVRQDLKAMYDLSMNDESHPEFMEAMLDKRNADWLLKLPVIFEQGTTFVAVGALHLAGDKGLIEGLRKAGYTVTPIEK